MKILIILFLASFFMSCANHRNAPLPGSTISTVMYQGNFNDCEKLARFKYCAQGEKIFIFENEKLIETAQLSENDTNYIVKISSPEANSQKNKSVFIKSGKMIKDWERYYPMIRASLLSNDIQVVESEDQSEQIVVVDYGVTYKNSGLIDFSKTKEMASNQDIKNKRFINFKSYSKKSFDPKLYTTPAWEVSVSSIGPGTDMAKILPILIASSRPYLIIEEETNIKGIMKENSIKVFAMNHFSKQQLKKP